MAGLEHRCQPLRSSRHSKLLPAATRTEHRFCRGRVRVRARRDRWSGGWTLETIVHLKRFTPLWLPFAAPRTNTENMGAEAKSNVRLRIRARFPEASIEPALGRRRTLQQPGKSRLSRGPGPNRRRGHQRMHRKGRVQAGRYDRPGVRGGVAGGAGRFARTDSEDMAAAAEAAVRDGTSARRKLCGRASTRTPGPRRYRRRRSRGTISLAVTARSRSAAPAAQRQTRMHRSRPARRRQTGLRRRRPG